MAGKSHTITPPEPEQPTLASESLEAEAKKVLSENQVKLLQMIAVSIGQDGMTVQEACQLVNINYEEFKEQALKFPVIQKVISLKELEYKRSLMKALSKRARAGDDKVASWILETRYPDEFGKKKSGDADKGADLLGQAVAFIQENGDSDSLITTGAKKPASPLPGVPRVPDQAAQELASFLV